jgi:hypothetical protein
MPRGSENKENVISSELSSSKTKERSEFDVLRDGTNDRRSSSESDGQRSQKSTNSKDSKSSKRSKESKASSGLVVDSSHPSYPSDVPQRGALPHPTDVNKPFLLTLQEGEYPDTVGIYKGVVPDNSGNHYFEIRGEMREIESKYINGVRPTVAGSHPEGVARIPFAPTVGYMDISTADASHTLALHRQGELRGGLAATTFEGHHENEKLYASYQANYESLRRAGVSVIDRVDIRNTDEAIRRLKNIEAEGIIHFQMPRVPQGTEGYSTQKLIHDTLLLPRTMKRPDVTVTIAVPDPDVAYDGKLSTHNRIYGIGSGNAVEGTGMRLVSYTDDAQIDQYGYEHKQSTVDVSTGVANQRRVYKFEADGSWG